MVLRGRVDRLIRQALSLAGALLETARRERDTLIVAYTHGQPAQPSTWGHYLLAVVEVLLRDISRLSEAREVLDHCPMGAAAITTSGFAIDRPRMADLLGFRGPSANSYGSIASVDYVTGLYSAMKLVFLHLGRVVQDLQFWTAFEVGQLYVPNALVQISSIMPQKRNPVPIEHLRHLASVTVGRCDMVVNTMHNTPFTDMNDSEGEVQVAGYGAFDAGLRVLALLEALLPACTVQSERVAANMDAACVTITELADSLVRHDGMSFRAAHEIAASTARAVIAEGQGLAAGYGAFCKAALGASGLDEAAYRRAVSPEHFVAVRERPGGPGPGAMDAALTGFGAALGDLAAKSDAFEHRVVSGDQARAGAFETLMGAGADG